MKTLYKCDDGTYDIVECGEITHQNVPQSLLAEAPDLLLQLEFLLIAVESGHIVNTSPARALIGHYKRLSAVSVLKRLPSNEKVSDLYDSDEQLANALRDLIGPSFEYPDWSHKTVGEILEQFERN